MTSLNQLFDIFPILSEDGNFVVDDPSVTAYGNFLAGVARIVDGFFKLPFNATGTALQLCGEIVPETKAFPESCCRSFCAARGG